MRKHSHTLTSTPAIAGKKKPARKSADREAGDASNKDPLKDIPVKRDFFGRVIQEPTTTTDSAGDSVQNEASKAGRRVWVTYHDGYSNAVRKLISMGELLAGL